jgi:hypothetical protein
VGLQNIPDVKGLSVFVPFLAHPIPRKGIDLAARSGWHVEDLRVDIDTAIG